jgi:SAM-dependent methyltransferase
MELAMRILGSYDKELEELEQHVRSQYVPGQVMQVLEAGCGREWYFKMDGLQYELTGLDLDAAALQARQELKKDIRHAVVGDLRTAELPAATYDVIYNAFVLEHVSGAERVLENFVRWLKPGGLMIVRVPDRDGVQGFVARYTPHWLHVQYYRWAWRMKDAGKPGFAPYPTIYDNVVSRPGLNEFCQRHGLDVIDEIGVGSYRRGHGLASRITPWIARIVSLLTLGRVHADYVDLTIVARKRG